MAAGCTSTYAASMEPCLFRHGKTPNCSPMPGLHKASMEPCLFRHGKRHPLVPDCAGSGASMEPCLFRHGKLRWNCLRWNCLRWLQWSHVFSDMVRTIDSTGFVGTPTLQWSHVFSDMVSRKRLIPNSTTGGSLQWSHVFSDMVRERANRERHTYGCFNGAMSFQTW